MKFIDVSIKKERTLEYPAFSFSRKEEKGGFSRLMHYSSTDAIPSFTAEQWPFDKSKFEGSCGTALVRITDGIPSW
jgi:hypothetical protein